MELTGYSNNEGPTEAGNVPKMDRREFLEETGETVAGIFVMSEIGNVLAEKGEGRDTVADMSDNKLTTEQKERLFEEQKEGYARLRTLAENRGEHREVISTNPSIILVTYDVVGTICGPEAATYASSGGEKIMVCSEDRIPINREIIGHAKKSHAIPSDVPENLMKAGYPGQGALLAKEDRRAMYDKAQARNDIRVQGFHEDCGACGGDTLLAKQLSTELDENGLHAAMISCGYSKECAMKMTGYPQFHHGLGLVIATSDNFAAERLPIASHMHLAAYLEPSDKTLNMHVSKLYGILMSHGWGPERSKKNPIVIMVAGELGNDETSARKTIERLHPAFEQLQEDFPRTFKVVGFDVPKAK